MRLATIAILGLALLAPWSAHAQDPCSGATQSDMSQCAAGHFKQADAELNQVWQQIQSKYADQPLFLARLKLAQRAWLKFRDAEMDATYPLAKGQDPRAQYGSVYPMCVSESRATLTQQRIKQLRVWLNGVEEGDVCAGSVKRPSELKPGGGE